MKRKFAAADIFCGAGGTTTGATEALEVLGYDVDFTAINHWPVAIATHTANHPKARHLCTGLDGVNPRDLYKPGQLKLFLASPECTHHSNARGGKPIQDQSRATAWCVIRWAEALLPETIIVENVPEFQTWGPLDSKGRPIQKRKGEIFRAWLANLRAIGYRVDYRVILTDHYGDPTSRRRLFIQAVRGRRKIVWPNRTHLETPESDKDRAWATAETHVIDWSISGTRLSQRKKPLAEKTMRRIISGFFKQTGLDPYLVELRGTSDRQVDGSAKPVNEPLGTVSTSGAHHAIVKPYVIAIDHQGGGDQSRGADRPLSTISTKARHALLKPMLIPQHSGNKARPVDRPAPTLTTTSRGVGLATPYLVQVNHGPTNESIAAGSSRTRPTNVPLPTVCGRGGEWALITPSLLPQQSGGELRPVNKPTPTVATSGAISLVKPYLIKFYGTATSSEVDKPLDTVTTKDRHALVLPLIEFDGQQYIVDFEFRMLQPHELAAAQSFRKDYIFTGNKTQQVAQIGNAVPRRTARALVLAAVSQNADITRYLDLLEPRDSKVA